jgi:hypothetical protein
MSHRPVCVECQVELRPKKNGVGCLDYFKVNGVPKKCQIWDADLWECPECHYQIVNGFGRDPIDALYTESFPKTVESYSKNSILIDNLTGIK